MLHNSPKPVANNICMLHLSKITMIEDRRSLYRELRRLHNASGSRQGVGEDVRGGEVKELCCFFCCGISFASKSTGSPQNLDRGQTSRILRYYLVVRDLQALATHSLQADNVAAETCIASSLVISSFRLCCFTCLSGSLQNAVFQ